MADVKLANRLAEILTMLVDGQSVTIAGLSEQFGVSSRTIMRDFDRLNYLDFIRDEKGIRLDPKSMGIMSTKDLCNFATISGIRELFPSLDRHFLRMMFDSTQEPSYLVKGRKSQDLSEYKQLFDRLSKVIQKQHYIRFRYHNKDYAEVQPYRLVNYKDLWYLAAVDQGKLKTFQLVEIKALWEEKNRFTTDDVVLQQIKNEETIWFGEQKLEVVLKVGPEAAYYFKRRDLVPAQEITKELNDGSLLVTSTVNNDKQIIPIVQYWIPHVKVISPECLQSTIDEQLYSYLGC
ncbi:WYL domain-containing protein [Photobacterium chitinilyticum]|uniref:helix-turn-helix transcriptional regulator n=1 Tax=Photobacterium chitinilyticum TaxID=2485123 RepID=UPI003D0A63C2